MKADRKAIIALCSSASFYEELVKIGERLEAMGFGAILPLSAREMKRTGVYSLASHTWHVNPNDYPKKAALMRAHFEEITRADAILVLNAEKHGQANYIGGNVLMEMALAFAQDKPIFIYYDAPEKSMFLEEILGVLPIFLHGKLERLTEAFVAYSSQRG